MIACFGARAYEVASINFMITKPRMELSLHALLSCRFQWFYFSNLSPAQAMGGTTTGWMGRRRERHDLEEAWEQHLSLINITLAFAEGQHVGRCNGNNGRGRFKLCAQGADVGQPINQFPRREGPLLS